MKRALLAIFGAILIVLGIGASGAGGMLAFLSGPDGVIKADAGQVSGNGYALVFNEFTVNTAGDTERVRQFAEFTMGAKSRTGGQIFLGIAPASDVNNYLQTSARDVVSDLSNGTARVLPIPGKTVPPAPNEQTFWTAKSQGEAPTISLAQSGDDQTLVIMNATAEQQVSVDITLGVESGVLFPLGLGLIVLGVLLLVVGIWMVVRAIRRRKGDEPPPSIGPVAGPQGPQAYVSNSVPAVAPTTGAPDQPTTVVAPPASAPPPVPPSLPPPGQS